MSDIKCLLIDMKIDVSYAIVVNTTGVVTFGISSLLLSLPQSFATFQGSLLSEDHN